jgi:hypothetical protein
MKSNNYINYRHQLKNDSESIYKSDSRRKRREKKIFHSTFFQRSLSRLIDKFWWNNIKEEDRDKVISLYSIQLNYLEKDFGNWSWSNQPFFENWNDWTEYIKKSFEVDKQKLREQKLRMIGIKNENLV